MLIAASTNLTGATAIALAEIADTVRGYHAHTEKQVAVARKRQQLRATRDALGAAGHATGDVDALLAAGCVTVDEGMPVRYTGDPVQGWIAALNGVDDATTAAWTAPASTTGNTRGRGKAS